MENKLVRVKNLKLVGSHGWDLMREGEAEKQKQYAALVWISRPLKDEDFQHVSSVKDLNVGYFGPCMIDIGQVVHKDFVKKIILANVCFALTHAHKHWESFAKDPNQGATPSQSFRA
ncbi:putative tRNA pseudouridine synthase Pus10-like [Trifolium medium]|uniref:tRNA pseudouridine(55) synthase n=1 Tax=Trifolium medium TaxID=97028 RepID=A0A392MSK0_9FABA|nr:putative tRNA pseudouridine synthase Pus10-like [Trifolium medium]